MRDTYCEYCKRRHRADLTQCEGCGAPHTAAADAVTRVGGAVLRLTVSERDRVNQVLASAISAPTGWVEVTAFGDVDRVFLDPVTGQERRESR